MPSSFVSTLIPLSTFWLNRDYTNPYLPVNPSAIEGTVQVSFIKNIFPIIYWFANDLTKTNFQPIVGPDGKKKEPESNVLLASIENMQYAVTVDVLHTVR